VMHRRPTRAGERRRGGPHRPAGLAALAGSTSAPRAGIKLNASGRYRAGDCTLGARPCSTRRPRRQAVPRLCGAFQR
jgi:hypothetical protein